MTESRLQVLVILLKGLDVVAGFPEGGDAESSRASAAQGGHDGSVGIDSRGANANFVSARGLAGGGVDDELNLAIFEKIERVGTALGQLEDALNFKTGFFENGCGAGSRDKFEPEIRKEPGDACHFLLVRITHADKDASAHREWTAGRHLRFGVGDTQVGVESHDFAGGTHFRRKENVLAMETVEGKDRFFDGPIVGADFFSETKI